MSKILYYYSNFMRYIYIAVNSFVELVNYILISNRKGTYFLSVKLNQDPLENYFGKQRARGGRNENPTVQQSLHNAAALRVQKSVALNPVRGNCGRKRRLYHEEDIPIDDTPLRKRKRKRK